MKEKFIKQLLDVIALNATCKKRKTSAILLKNGSLISIGYNGAVRKADECEEVGCLLPVKHCERCVHAEDNAIINCARNGISTIDSEMYCLHFPCRNCLRVIVNAGIKKVYYYNDYTDEANKILMKEYLDKKLIELEELKCVE